MIYPINNVNKKDYIAFKFSKQSDKIETDYKSVNLSDCRSSQTILTSNNISIKKSLLPIDITNKYKNCNVKAEHLDLPNIHILEYPDTNLQVFINADENITTDNNSILDCPKIQVFILNNNPKKSDYLKELILFNIIQKKLKNISTDIDISISNGAFSYNGFYDKNFLNNLPLFNKTFFNLNISEKDLEKEKNEFNNLIDKSNVLLSLYDKSDFKSKEEISEEIKNLKLEDLNSYYDEYKQNIIMQMFVTVSKEYFDNNKKELYTTLNRNIGQKLIKNDNSQSELNFALNEKLKIISSTNSNTILNYPIPLNSVYDDVIGTIAIRILNNNLSSDYKIGSEYFTLPYTFKNNTSRKESGKFYRFEIKDKFDNNSLVKYQKSLAELLNSPLENELELVKEMYKEELKNTFTGECLDIIKSFELVRYCEDIFNLYEIIDSISENDIKNYVKRYFIKQQPIIELEGSNEHNSD